MRISCWIITALWNGFVKCFEYNSYQDIYLEVEDFQFIFYYLGVYPALLLDGSNVVLKSNYYAVLILKLYIETDDCLYSPTLVLQPL